MKAVRGRARGRSHAEATLALLAWGAGVVGGWAAVRRRRSGSSSATRETVAEEQAALRRVATLVAHEAAPAEVFAAVAQELRTVLHTEFADISRYEADNTFTIVAGNGPVVGTVLSLDADSVTSRVYRARGPARSEDYSLSAEARRIGIRSAVAAPIIVGDRLWGAAIVASTRPEPLPADTEARAAGFTELVATAIANTQARADLTTSRARIVAAADQARRRMERDLHEGVQQRLATLALDLDTVAADLPPGSHDLGAHLSDVRRGLTEVLDELREIARGIHPAALAEGGLPLAVATLARRCPLPVDVHVTLDRRLPGPVELTAYYVASEALTNAVKHARATTATIRIEHDDDHLTLAVGDDGAGGADPERGSGLVGLADRVTALGGTITVDSPPGRGTALTVTLPVGADGCDAGT